MPTSLGGNAFTRKYIKYCPVLSKSCDLCICVRFEVTTSNGLGEYAFTRNFIFAVNVTYNRTQYPFYHVTYAHAKFEATTSNILGGDAFARKKKTLFEQHWDQCPVPST